MHCARWTLKDPAFQVRSRGSYAVGDAASPPAPVWGRPGGGHQRAASLRGRPPTNVPGLPVDPRNRVRCAAVEKKDLLSIGLNLLSSRLSELTRGSGDGAWEPKDAAAERIRALAQQVRQDASMNAQLAAQHVADPRVSERGLDAA